MNPLHRQVPALLLVLLAGCGVQQQSAAPVDSAATTDFAWQEPPIPDGPMGESIRRGLAILRNTRDSLPEYVGNDLNCLSCHLHQGTRRDGLPLIGVYARFPQYNARAARVFNLEDRINGCFVRSMNGRMLPDTARAMRDMVAWMAHMSEGLPVGGRIPGQGVPRPEILSGDTVAGAAIWMRTCASCHGIDGQGTPLAP